MKDLIRKSSKGLFFILSLGGLIAVLAQPATIVNAYKPSQTPVPMQQSDTTIAIKLSKEQVNPGDQFDVTVSITSDAQSKGTQFTLEFDPSKVEVSGVDTGTYYSDWAKSYGNGAEALTVPSPAVDNSKGIMPATAFFLVGVKEAKGPTGTGTLAILHAKAKDGSNGTVSFKLSGIEVTDTNVAGNPQKLGGVKIQDANLTIGSGTPAEQPKAVGVNEPTAKAVTGADQSAQPTVARRVPSAQDSTSSGSTPWGIILPVGGGVLVVAVAAFFFMNKPKGKKSGS
jgi:hypothetical protein